ncbi:SMP-30/gluconolactonase/LRE family protein [Pelagicoccus mobilis]|uniref:SMP-30/gluconolactonase/LRE family protein n=1 Tax=Pelagicoccus mobilis TaxID=415221 RepID=UPI00190503FE|nr:SMP-30/gluconolactonase/LRE family protein [Pelagicoccus mobilis]
MPIFTSGFLTAGTDVPSRYPTIGKITKYDDRLDSVLDTSSKIEVIASGFDWTEGPAWNRDGGYLVFSDIPRNVVMKWSESEGLSEYLRPSGYTGRVDYGGEPGSNGLLFDNQGRLTLCEHGDRRVAVLTQDGGKRTLADNYKGMRFNSPNDLCYHENGNLYFTDPIYGLPKRQNDPRREMDFCGVYLLRPSGEVVLLTKEFSRPNGIGLSPDGETLYVAQSDGRAPIWKSFPVMRDGTLGEGKVFFDASTYKGDGVGMPDGMAIDVEGNIWATGPAGVYVFTPQGELLGRIEPGEHASNCAWGDDGSTLYMTVDMYVCRIRTKAKGLGF